MSERTRPTTKEMVRQYKIVQGNSRWRWYDQPHEYGQSFLELAGHRIATVRPEGWQWSAFCPGGLVATRSTRALAKKAAVAAVCAWLSNAIEAADGYPLTPCK